MPGAPENEPLPDPANRPRTPHRWTQDDEDAFLANLASGMNVKRAANEIGFSHVALYQRRMKHPGFAQRWAQALAVGYDRVEAAAIENAIRVLEGVEERDEQDGACLVPRMTVAEALRFLAQNRAMVRGGFRRRDHRLQAADPETARREIIAMVQAMRDADDDGDGE